MAKINGETLHFKGGLFSLDGTIALTVEEEINIKKVKEFGEKIAIKILREGGKRLMAQIKSEF
ncbi:MAG: porphobilinogen deaminase [Flavobacteriaceae bacterium]